MKQLLFLILTPLICLGTVKKANCRLTFHRTYKDGKSETSYKDVYTTTKEVCDRLSLKGDFKESSRTDFLKSKEAFNCLVSVLREGKEGEVLEYYVHAKDEKECKKKGSEKRGK